MKQGISMVSFVYNEEKNIRAWIENLVPYVSQIVIFDLESTDKTYDLCREYVDTIVFKRPYLLCGDYYKQELMSFVDYSWVLWSYPDERFSENVLQKFNTMIELPKFDSFSFMRQEYIDGIRAKFNEHGEIKSFGTAQCPNYQNRLHKVDKKIFYTELVHAELHGQYTNCNMPPEFYMEHWKTSIDQEFDNVRLYVLYNQLINKYIDTKIEPYKTYVSSYKTIVRDSEAKNLSGERKIHLAEEFWWDWRKYSDTKRITLGEFEQIVGISYEKFLINKQTDKNRIFIESGVIDEILIKDKK